MNDDSFSQKVLDKLAIRADDVAIELSLTNEMICKYIDDFLSYSCINIDLFPKEKLNHLFNLVKRELMANIYENYGYELDAIIPVMNERLDK